MVRWKFPSFSLTLLVLFLISPRPLLAGEKWYETGRSDKVPQSRYLTGLGYGSTLDRARKDAARNLANQIDSDIRSKYEQKTSRNNLAISRSTRDILAVRTHAKLYGLKNVRGKFIPAQGSYVALVAVDRNDLVRYLKGRISSLRETISSLREDLGNTSNSLRQIHDLSGVVRAKEKAAFFDR
ncbi:MAG: LPP20 family lipoprotein, partial [Nitrospiraceae bacterium]|nr:LPP20 family lipoprotein [Nitrospiraceae bacterium]